jgi:hypothetical protein
MPGVPELADSKVGLKKFFDVQKFARDNLQASLFSYFPLSSGGQLFFVLDSTPGSNPEVVLPWLHVTHEQKPVFVLNDGAGGKTMLHCAA